MSEKGSGKKWIYVAVAVVVLGYVADAVYPKWEWECSAQGEFHAMSYIPEVKDDPHTGGPFRHLSLTIPKGCKATPHNLLRRFADWVAK